MKHLLLPYLLLIRAQLRRHLFVPARRYFGPKIPIAMITGTKGKTTTTRMLSHILTKAGYNVGSASSDGVIINGEYIFRDDIAGYRGARMVLKQPSITAAVLETARGGLLKFGLYIDRCHVAALLNVGREQIGIDGIETVEEMAALKKKVIDAARDRIVLNADDTECAKMIASYPDRQVVLFSLGKSKQLVSRYIEMGGVAYILNKSGNGDIIERRSGDWIIPVISVSDLPSSGNGIFTQNIANAMAAAALAEGMKIPMDIIREALHTFENSLEHSPGRLNFIEGYKQIILLDCTATVPSGVALAESVKRIEVPGRKICMCTTVGNRPDWHYTEIGEALSGIFDYFVCYDIKEYRRGRAPGEIAKLLKSRLMDAGVPVDAIDTVCGYEDATKALSEVVGEKDLVVIQVANAHQYMHLFKEHFGKFASKKDADKS